MSQHVPEPERTDVVIVGAGPTGLTAAVRLAQLGIPHVVLEAAPAPTTTSKAALVHASSLELLSELGVADDLVAVGQVMHRIVLVDRGRLLVRVDLTGLPSRYPFALGVPQSTTEALLLRRLDELGGSVRRSHRVGSVRTDADGPVVSGVVESAGGQAFEIHARYVVGADGSHSCVRAALGLDFPGETYPSQFLLADVALAGVPGPSDEATIAMSPAGVTVLGPLPGGTHRVVATVDGGTQIPPAPDRAFLDALLRERGVQARTAAEPVWSSRFLVHHRVADRFRVGPAFLAGDAAHVHSPAAGQGMNTGIADAYDLATRMAAVLTGQAEGDVLDGYERTRRNAALEVLRLTDRITGISMLRRPIPRTARRLVAHTLGRLPAVQHRVAMSVAGLARSPLRGDLPSVTSPPRSRGTAPLRNR
jgi:2-polyprenyl-6-methoxyphenol hydroxylase-like FAD-dependent oxidoreductase